MPASEETYRPQPTLHIIFAISSIAMLLATVWMVMADHLRPWKQVQRDFQVIEREKLEAAKEEKLKEQQEKYANQLKEIEQKIEAAKAGAGARAAEISQIDRELNKLGAKAELLGMQRRFKKADLDSKRSLYDGMVDRGEEHAARSYLTNVVAGAEEKLDQLSKELEAADAKLKAKQTQKEELLGYLDKLEDERNRITREADRVERTIEQKDALHGGPLHWYSGPMAFMRSLPGFDLMPPTKIQQISLPDLTINYNFKEVPRYDRCMTCHQGIDRIGYDKKSDGEEMPKVFAAHPHLTSGATTIDPKGKVVTAGLYLDGNGPHPVNSFGCTVCHGGQGSGTEFTFASHTPDSLKQGEEWHEEYGWHSYHFWDYPMLPKRFVESSCLKCHHDVTDVPDAKKLQAGYQRIVKYGCTGCHTIGGEGSYGPDLTDEPQVGPNLAHVGSKVSKEWILKWIIDPHAFRPDSRMPRFYGLNNNAEKEDWPKNYAEANAIAHYLFAKSTEPADFVDPPAKTDPAKGKELFLQKGCMACHQHRPYQVDEVQLSDKKAVNPAYYSLPEANRKDANPDLSLKGLPKLDPAATYDPKNFPASVRDKAMADFGPNLSNISAKFQSKAQGLKWLANWINTPEKYHPKSLMPNLQLSFQDAADIASWILSVPGEWPVTVDVPGADSKDVKAAVDELVTLYVSKSGSFKKADGKAVSKSLSEVEEFVTKELKLEDKLLYLGERTISRLGCFGCHNIPGYENAKPIGTALNDWGLKSPARLDYGHIREFLEEQAADMDKTRDGTPLLYQEEVAHETRTGFLFEKLHRPRSYDYLKKSEKYKPWDDRLRMPQFAWANKPEAIEEVMTFVLGLTGERIPSRYLAKTHYTPAQQAVAQGSKVVNRHNCTGCHVFEMPKYSMPEGMKVADVFTDFKSNLRTSYSNRANDFLELYPGLTYDPSKKLGNDEIEGQLGLAPDDGKTPIAIEGMQTDVAENEVTVQLWKPVTIRGYTFNVGDNITLDKTKIRVDEGLGGNFGFLYAAYQSDKTGSPYSPFWNRLPPPLLREGNKVQTPWLTAFLKDPYPIRPAVQLRMPRFHYGKSEQTATQETGELANYFAARDRAEFPYQLIAERTPSYLEEREKAHPNYLGAGWEMMTAKGSPCLQCHAIGQYKPTGGEGVVNGPELRQVAPRFRPEYLETWLAKPSRLVPFTAMPQNVAPHGAIQMPVPKTFENKPTEMVRAIRDTLLNYVNAVELQLASSNSKTAAAPAGATATKTTSTTP
ncbi:MAG: c-type cytochrome [Isosphaeraceae bacterium]